MARPIRTLTEARGYATAKHVYVLLESLQFTLRAEAKNLLHLPVSRHLAVQVDNTHARSPRSWESPGFLYTSTRQSCPLMVLIWPNGEPPSRFQLSLHNDL
jgi:hypothetical protein